MVHLEAGDAEDIDGREEVLPVAALDLVDDEVGAVEEEPVLEVGLGLLLHFADELASVGSAAEDIEHGALVLFRDDGDFIGKVFEVDDVFAEDVAEKFHHDFFVGEDFFESPIDFPVHVLRREAGGGGFRASLRPGGTEVIRVFHTAKMGRNSRVN